MPDGEPLRDILTRVEAKIDTALAYKGRYILTPSKAIAQALGCSVRTLHRWRHDPENPLPCAHFGNGVATTPSLLDTWLERRWELEARRARSRPRTREHDRIKVKIVARVAVPEDEGEGSNVSPLDFPLREPVISP